MPTLEEDFANPAITTDDLVDTCNVDETSCINPKVKFSNDAGVTFQTQVAGVYNLPPAGGQPPRSMPSFNVNSQSTILPPLVPIPATTVV